MNLQMICVFVGRILLTEAALLALPCAVGFLYGEDPFPFLMTMFLLVAIGLLLGYKKPKSSVIYARDGFAVVALAWLLLSAFGAIPFVISGDIPNYVDAFFETVSGFTTTGASILREIEPLSRGGLFWRSFTHWVGGMGVLVFVMAILPGNEGSNMHVMRAEVPGPTVGKLVSRLSDTARILYQIYFVMTVIEIVLLMLVGMPLYDACIHSFGTAGTGGFSHLNSSVGTYGNPVYEVIIGVFMLLFGVNFNLYYFLLLKKFKDVFGSEELKAYVGIVAAAVIAITVDIAHMYGSVLTALRLSFFQVASIITTTGYGTCDFNLWPSFSKGILVVLMFVGAMAGSTGGGIKVARIVIMVKSSFCEMKKMLHPNAVITPRFEDRPLGEQETRSVHVYLTIYMLIFSVSFLLLCLEQFDLVTTFTALAACINNIGPGLEVVGPAGNFADFSAFSKLLLSFNMLVGRLEIFPMLLLFAPSIWKRRIVRSKAYR